jgi:hypothetical protein
MRSVLALAAAIAVTAGGAQAQEAPSILFIGNSFTYGYGSAAYLYRAHTVTDLNDEGIGGVPALFKSFADQSDLDYDVYLETRGGSNFDFHVENKLDVIGNRGWDKVVAHGYSTLDADEPGEPTRFVAMGRQLADILRDRNPAVEIYWTATWSRADKTYVSDEPWFGQPIGAMALDVRAGYDLLASGAAGVESVNPVGEAWTRAIETGVADGNPYDGIDVDKLDLWTYDHYHASTAGYYLEALVVFGNVTGRDPRSLGRGECSGMELGLSSPQVEALQLVAYDQLTADGIMTRAAEGVEAPRRARPCAA